MSVKNVEPFYKSESELITSLREMTTANKEKTEAGLKEMFLKVKDSTWFKQMLLDNNFVELALFFDEFYLANITEILDRYQDIGSYNSLTDIIRLILGQTTDVFFTCTSAGNSTEAGNLTITISNVPTFEVPILDEDLGQPILDEKDGEPILAIINRITLNSQQLRLLLSQFIPAGIKYNFIFLA